MTEFTLEGTATKENGVQVPVKITIEYPENHGLTAWNTMRNAAESHFEAFLQELIRQGDLEVIEVMQRNGAEIEEDEFGDDD